MPRRRNVEPLSAWKGRSPRGSRRATTARPTRPPARAQLSRCPACGQWELHTEPPGPSGTCYTWCAHCDHEDELLGTTGAVDILDFLQWKLPPRRWVVEGLIQERDAVMVHAFRGWGKSRFIHGLAVHLAAGLDFLRYTCPEPRGVLLIDGELPREDLYERVQLQADAIDRALRAPCKLLAADLLAKPMPSLATRAGREFVHDQLDGVDLVILDSISTLCTGTGPENEAASWDPIQSWLLDLRRQGLSVMLVHHDGKNGAQRGTSKREDILSQVVHLIRPSDYTNSDGARFEVHLSKARGVYGPDADPFEATCQTDENGLAAWTWKNLEDTTTSRILELAQQGHSQRAIAKQVSVSLASVNRTIQKLRREGTLEE